MIDEKKLIEDIGTEIKCMNVEKERYFKDGNFHNGNIIVEQISAIKIIKKIINSQPKIGEWISFDEKLPNDKHLIWISVEYKGGIADVIEGIFIDGKPCHMNRVNVDPIAKAWMPRYIPRPYHL